MPPVDVSNLSTDIGSDQSDQNSHNLASLAAEVDVSEPLMVVPPVDVSKLLVEEPQSAVEQAVVGETVQVDPGQTSFGGRRLRPGRAIPAIEDPGLVEGLGSDAGSSGSTVDPEPVPGATAVAALEATTEPASEAVPEQPASAEESAVNDYSAPALAPAPLPPTLVDVEEEDELLSELLDSELIAQTQAPREDNPFAIGFAFEVSLETLPAAVQGDTGNPGVVAEQALTDGSSVVSEESTGLLEVTTAPPEALPTDESGLEATVAPASASVSGNQGQTLSGTTFPAAHVAQTDDSAGSGAAQDISSAEQTSQIEDQSASPTGNQESRPETSGGVARGQVAGGESQESSGMGVSGFSGGPPPKRRRT